MGESYGAGEGTTLMSMQQAAVTFDVDWAPDWAIDLCMEHCERAGVSSTFFVTHESACWREVEDTPTIELGIHPNLLAGSTQGASYEEVFDYCMNLVPAARSMRTHSLVQSSRMFALVADQYPQLEVDVSLFLYMHPDLAPVDFYYGASERRITRLPYFWEDDVAAAHPQWEWQIEHLVHTKGLAIFDFHPIHVALNTGDMNAFAAFRRAFSGVPLHTISRADIEPFRNKGMGVETFLQELLGVIRHQSTMTISAIQDSRESGACA